MFGDRSLWQSILCKTAEDLAKGAVDSGKLKRQLARVPNSFIQKYTQEAFLERFDGVMQGRLLRLLCADPRPSIRVAATATLLELCPPTFYENEITLQYIAEDPELAVQRTLHHGLSGFLGRLPGLDRTAMMTGWALSASEPVRYALAVGLVSLVDGAGVWSALEALVHDPSERVRRAAAQGIVVRDGEAYVHLVEEHERLDTSLVFGMHSGVEEAVLPQ